MRFLKFSAKWCGSCKTLKETIKNWDSDITSKIEDIDIDEQMKVAREYRIKSLPTIVVINDDGIEIDRLVGPSLAEKNLLKHIGKS